MNFAKVTAALVFATVHSAVGGALLASDKSSIANGFNLSPGASLIPSVHSATMLKGMHFSASPSLSILQRPFTQSGGYPLCDASNEDSLRAAVDCVECRAEETCDATTCLVTKTEDMSDTQLFLCPAGECCTRLIFDSSDELLAFAIDGLIVVGDELDLDLDKCPPCAFSDSVQCETYDVPAINARSGADVECSDGSSGSSGSSGGTTGSTTEATRRPAVTSGSEENGASESAGASGATFPTTDSGDRTAGNGEESGESGKCFPAEAQVELENSSLVRMDALSIGDSVKVGPNKYSKVFMFTHKMADVSVEVIVLRTASGASLSLTSSHYIYANDALVTAGSVRVGDQLALGDGGRSVVTSVSRESSRGLYNPQTLSGDIVVNGVVASTYTTAVDPGFAHFALAPLRALSHLGFRYTGLESGAGCLTEFTPRGNSIVL